MKLKDIASQLANRINRPHVIEVYLRQVYAKGFVDGTKKSPWISVKYCLPEPGKEVLLYDNHSLRHYVIGWLREKKGYNSSMWALTNGYVKDNDITHWRSIPEFNK